MDVLLGDYDAFGGLFIVFTDKVVTAGLQRADEDRREDLPAITFSRLRSLLSNSSGVASWFWTISLIFFPDGTVSSAGSNR